MNFKSFTLNFKSTVIVTMWFLHILVCFTLAEYNDIWITGAVWNKPTTLFWPELSQMYYPGQLSKRMYPSAAQTDYFYQNGPPSPPIYNPRLPPPPFDFHPESPSGETRERFDDVTYSVRKTTVGEVTPERFGYEIPSIKDKPIQRVSPSKNERKPTELEDGDNSSQRPQRTSTVHKTVGSTTSNEATPERFGYVVPSARATSTQRVNPSTNERQSPRVITDDSSQRSFGINSVQTAAPTPVIDTTLTTTSEPWTFPPITQDPVEAKIQISMCISKCTTDKNIKSVCGSDNKTYQNRQFLDCAQQCGQNVKLEYTGRCIPNPPSSR